MTSQYLRTFDNYSPKGYDKESFTTRDMEKVGKRWRYHPERLNGVLFGDVAETLSKGKVIAYPLGRKRLDVSVGIKFRFEHTFCIAMLPESRSGSTLVVIATEVGMEAPKMLRVAHVFADHFDTEYKKLYSGGIAISKQENNVT